MGSPLVLFFISVEPAARKAMCLTVIIMLFAQLSGVFVLQSYTSSVFKDAGSSLPIIESSIVIVLFQIVANLLTTYFIDKIGRKVKCSVPNLIRHIPS